MNLNRDVLISVIIVNYNLTDSIRILLNSIKKYVTDIAYEVIVVDNNSADRSIELLEEEFREYKFIFLNTNYGFGHGNNAAFKYSSGEYLLFLNPDTYLINNLLLTMYKLAKMNPDFGIIGPRMIFPDGKFQISTANFPSWIQEIGNISRLSNPVLKIINLFRYKIFTKKFYEVDYIFGSCMLINSKLYENLKGFDEGYFLFDEDADICYRTWNDTEYKVIYAFSEKIVHLKSQVTGKDMPRRLKLGYESRLKFIQKNYSFSKRTTLKASIICMFLLKYVYSFLRKNKMLYFRHIYKSIIVEYFGK